MLCCRNPDLASPVGWSALPIKGYTVPPEDMTVGEVRDALRMLYDSVALANSPLAQRFPQIARVQDLSARAARLRSILLDGIELLQPPLSAAFLSPAVRCYEVLARHFAEQRPLAQIAEALNIGERQAYRDLARAEAGLTQLLRTYPWRMTSVPEGSSEEQDALHEELRALCPQTRAVDLVRTLRSAFQIVKPLAVEWRVMLECDMAADAVPSLADEALLRQTLVHALSIAVRHTAERRVLVCVHEEPGTAQIMMRLRLAPGCSAEEAFAEARRLAQAQHMTWQVRSFPDGVVVASLTVPSSQRNVALVIEDNEGAIELYRRYLATTRDWHLIGVSNSRASYELARSLQPAVIILDLLMPYQDGWSVLRTLRSQPETEHIPILVCSVFDELDLAYALGASAYVKKPVSQFQLLAALEKCLQEHRSQASPESQDLS